MVGSDELSWQQAAGHRLWSSFEDCTDTKHRQEFLLLLDNVMERKSRKLLDNCYPGGGGGLPYETDEGARRLA